jgi:hypothetical protein
MISKILLTANKNATPPKTNEEDKLRMSTAESTPQVKPTIQYVSELNKFFRFPIPSIKAKKQMEIATLDVYLQVDRRIPGTKRSLKTNIEATIDNTRVGVENLFLFLIS